MLRITSPSSLLRSALLADAAASGGMGLLLAIGSSALAPLLGLPEALLLWAGVALVPFAAFVAWAGTRPDPAAGGLVRPVIAVNYAWVAASIGLLILSSAAPTPLGLAFVGAQALAVLMLAIAQSVAVARLRNRAANV